MSITLVVTDDKGMVVDQWEGEHEDDYPDEDWLKRVFAEAAEGEKPKEKPWTG